MQSSIANSLGVGSGIDTAALVRDLAAASRTPKAQRFDTLARTNQSKISALAQARSDLDSFADSLANLAAGGTLRSQPTISDANAIAVTSNPGALLGSYSGEIVISSLARAQTIYSGYVASAENPVGQGGMTLVVGANSYPVTVGASNDSLNGLSDAINATGSGVRASVINDAGNFRLVLKGESGAAKAFSLTADPGSGTGLAQFASDAMEVGQSASDAAFTVDGVAYVRPVNSFSDVVPGMTISLKKADPLVAVTIGAARPNDVLRQTIRDFVSVFNTLRRDLEDARIANNGNPALRGFERQLGAFIGQPMTSNANIRSLADVGISTNRDGTVSLNSAKLEAALRDFPDAVEAIFNPPRDNLRTEATDPGIAFALDALRDAAIASTGPLEQVRLALQRESENIAKNRQKMEARESAYQARLEKQYAGMDARIAALKGTQSYLEQQIKLWNSEN
ncbi:MAG: flagellar filament capping protein FliD [Sphingomonadaceae bacterium]|nr:flagellar filament capping protein FliD [Sphingomonadaceae bacterium]